MDTSLSHIMRHAEPLIQNAWVLGFISQSVLFAKEVNKLVYKNFQLK